MHLSAIVVALASTVTAAANVNCDGDELQMVVESGDSCFALAEAYEVGFQDIFNTRTEESCSDNSDIEVGDELLICLEVGDETPAPPASPCGDFLLDVEYTGPDVAFLEDTESESECCDECQANADCIAFSFISIGSGQWPIGCRLKDSLEQRPLFGVISGLRGDGTTPPPTSSPPPATSEPTSAPPSPTTAPPSPTSAPPSPTTAPPSSSCNFSHTVEAGDTCYELELEYGVASDDIYNVRTEETCADNDEIEIGDVLRISGEAVGHVVALGDTCFVLALEYGVAFEDIYNLRTEDTCAVNDELYIGDELAICPDATTVTSPSLVLTA
jgi:LysM repeat protein